MGEAWQRVGYWFLQFYRWTIYFFLAWWLWPAILGVVLLMVCLPFLLWGWFFTGGYQHGGHSFLMAAPVQSESRESATTNPMPSAYDDTPQIVERLNRVDEELHELYLRIDELRDQADARFSESSTVVGGKWEKLAALDPDIAFRERFTHLETLTRVPPGQVHDAYARSTIREWADSALLQLAQYAQELDQIEKIVLDSPPKKATNRLAK